MAGSRSTAATASEQAPAPVAVEGLAVESETGGLATKGRQPLVRTDQVMATSTIPSTRVTQFPLHLAGLVI